MLRIPIINRFTCFESQLKTTINLLNSKGFNVILDYANEDTKHINKNYSKIKNLIYNYPNNYIAIKLSSLNIKNDVLGATNKCFELCDKAIINNCKILIDAEDYKIQNDINDVSTSLMKHYNKNDVNVYKTYQMYRKDTFELLKKDLNLERKHLCGIKLVRGAYYNQDFKYNILFKNINETHDNYNKAINYFNYNSDYNDKLIIASHNLKSVDIGLNKNTKNIEYSQLMGMSDDLSNYILENGGKVYKYLPYGNILDTWPYLIRRLYENPYMFFNIFK